MPFLSFPEGLPLLNPISFQIWRGRLSAPQFFCVDKGLFGKKEVTWVAHVATPQRNPAGKGHNQRGKGPPRQAPPPKESL